MFNSVKNHEKNEKTVNYQEQVNNILDSVENTPFALSGATVKTVLYFLFSLIAALELTTALFFYSQSLGLPYYVSIVGCGGIGFGFHYLLHTLLVSTANGVVFSKMKESHAMSNEVKANILLSIVLLIIAACTVFFVGKKGFTAYRATQYEAKEQAAKGEKKDGEISLNDVKLKDKNGKIAAWKLETVVNLESAKTKRVEAETNKDKESRLRYDETTKNITDIVGASAFVLELLLALLAYAIATAKLAAVIQDIAKRNNQAATEPQPQAQINPIFTPTPTPSVNRNKIGFLHLDTSEQLKEVQRIHAYTNAPISQILNVLETNNFAVPLTPEQMFTLFRNDINTTIEPQSQTPQRAVIKGFLSEKNDTTASVNGKRLTANVRTCLNCESEFIYKIHNQKFCCEDCRIEAWEQKTGAKLKKVKK